MNKLAIFAEGQTEEIFAQHLVSFLGSDIELDIQIERVSGGRGSRNRVIQLRAAGDSRDFFVLIVTCGQDDHVKSDLLDRYQGLVDAGYNKIVAIKDLFPKPREEEELVREGFEILLPVKPVHPVLVLAVMEIEAWFLAEHTHFNQIRQDLTMDLICTKLGFDPSVDDMQNREHPANDLENAYFLVLLNYHKTRAHVERTVDAIDFPSITTDVANKFRDLERLIELIRSFFGSSVQPET